MHIMCEVSIKGRLSLGGATITEENLLGQYPLEPLYRLALHLLWSKGGDSSAGNRPKDAKPPRCSRTAVVRCLEPAPGARLEPQRAQTAEAAYLS